MERDQYLIRRADPSDVAEVYALMRSVWQGLENREVFAVEDLPVEWVRENMTERGFGVTARTPDGELAGMLIVVSPGSAADNLGLEAGLSGAELEQVRNMDVAAVLPAHRGHGLERRMLAYAEELMAAEGPLYLMATISPDNPPSLRTAEKLGYRVLTTKNMYGEHLRYILVKPIGGADMSVFGTDNASGV